MDSLMYGEHWQDLLAFSYFMLCWMGYIRYSDREEENRNSLVTATNRYRLQWMREMMKRENRSVDAIIIGNLTRSFTFFASTTMFILAALVSLLGYRDRVNTIIQDIPYARLNDPLFWEVKIFLLIMIFIYAFFKYTWSMRQYNYVSIYIAAAPDHRERLDEHESLAVRGAQLTSNAARHFNNGLRAYYFGLATLSWFIHPYLLLVTTTLVVLVTYRREFRSSTLKTLNS